MIYPNMPNYLPSLRLSRISGSVIALFLTAFVLVSPVSAYELSPGNMVLPEGASSTVSILATDTTTNGVSVHVTLQGLKVTGFEAAEGILNIGVCDNGSSFDETEVCVDLAAREDFVQGQILGSFTVIKSGSEDASMTIASDSKYANGTAVTAMSYKVTQNAQELPTAPNRTTQAINNVLPLLIVAGVILILIVLMLVYILKGRKGVKYNAAQTAVQTQTLSADPMSAGNVVNPQPKTDDRPILPPLN